MKADKQSILNDDKHLEEDVLKEVVEERSSKIDEEPKTQIHRDSQRTN